uniref:Uncharacterized protein n=1 Tax=Oryza brachyantha TaxID=4533 RepID=J3NDZ5_ORYBR
ARFDLWVLLFSSFLGGRRFIDQSQDSPVRFFVDLSFSSQKFDLVVLLTQLLFVAVADKSVGVSSLRDSNLTFFFFPDSRADWSRLMQLLLMKLLFHFELIR